MQLLARALAWFVPHSANVDERMRARTFVMTSFGMALLLGVAAVFHRALRADSLPLHIAPGICTALVVLPFLLRLTQKLRTIALLGAAAVAVGPIAGAFDSGLGVHSPLMMVTTITPVLAAAFVGRMGAVMFCGVSLITVALAYYLVPASPALLSSYHGLSPIVAMALSALAVLSGYFSWLFETERARAHRQLADSETRYRELADQLAYQVSRDALTGVKNRFSFDRTLEKATAPEAGSERFALMYVDVDRFKPVNDELGHEVGDMLLTAIAQRIERAVRDGDLVFRLGGDEFAVMLPHTEDAAIADLVAARVVDAIAAPFSLRGHVVRVGASVGIAQYPEHGTTADALIRSADHAMYCAKRDGGQRAMFVSMRVPHDSGVVNKPGPSRNTPSSTGKRARV